MKTLIANELINYAGCDFDLVCEKIGLFKYQIRCLNDNKILSSGFRLRKYVDGIIKVMYDGKSKSNYDSVIIESDLFNHKRHDGHQFVVCRIQ